MPTIRDLIKTKILGKLGINKKNGMVMKDFKKDTELKIYSEQALRDALGELIDENKILGKAEKRERDYRTNIVYKPVA